MEATENNAASNEKAKPKDMIAEKLRDPETRRRIGIAVEVVLILLWALWVGREFLDFNENIVPKGREFGSAVVSHHFWTQVKE